MAEGGRDSSRALTAASRRSVSLNAGARSRGGVRVEGTELASGSLLLQRTAYRRTTDAQVRRRIFDIARSTIGIEELRFAQTRHHRLRLDRGMTAAAWSIVSE
jgi:hypothetical protein